ncbi:MAG TPA: peptide chain release factor N(5)-glutamine methyltransferase [Terriglobales bacterium]|nr:peptide chain release factor N(5)-glutamine methyltransferase [Terriglobales bacterium]
MTLKQALTSAIAELEANAVGSPRMNAEVLLMLTLGCDRAYLYSHPERELTADEQSRYDEAIARRASGYPSQYITGHQEFWGLDLIVTPAVLIPRPETEHIVEVVTEIARAADYSEQADRPKLVDVGTGSGAIALALAKELPKADVLATDVSTEALEVARANAVRLQLESRIRFEQSDVLGSVTRDGTFDFVISNPPYVALSEADKVQDVVKKFEPKQAVFAGEHGLDIIRRLIPQAHEALRPGGHLVMEIGYSMSEQVMAIMDAFEEVHAVPDLAGIPRVVVGTKPTHHRDTEPQRN